MKRVLLILALAGMTGCSPKVMNQSFAPFTTSEGVQGWRFATVNYPEGADVSTVIEHEVGRRQICPGGWRIVKREPAQAAGFDIVTYEGQCR